MILVNLEKRNEQNEIVKKALDFLEQEGWGNAAPGRHQNDDGIFFSPFGYDTKDLADCKWEAHRKYVDIQVAFEGKELIRVADIKDMQMGEYIEERDFIGGEGDVFTEVELNPEQAVVLFPEDVHMPSISIDDTHAPIRKTCIKIPAELFG